MEDKFAACDSKNKFSNFSILHHILSLIWGLSAPSMLLAPQLIVIQTNKNTSLALGFLVVSVRLENIIQYKHMTCNNISDCDEYNCVY